MLPRLFLLGLAFIPLTGNAELNLRHLKIELTEMDRVLQLDGIVEAGRRATLSAQITGRAEQLHFDVGDLVKKDQIVMTVRNSRYRARLENARANLLEARTQFDEVSLEHQRINKLFDKKLVAAAAQDSINSKLGSSRARLKAAEATVTESQDDLDNTIIRAPYSGIVLERLIEPGELVQVGQPIMRGYSRNPLRISVQVPQTSINKIDFDTGVLVTINEQDVKVGGSEISAFPYANPDTHSLEVRILLQDVSDTILPGMSGKISFKIGSSTRLLIPRQALQIRSELTSVYVLDENGKPALRQISTGSIFDNQIEVLSGLWPGEIIVLNPASVISQINLSRVQE